jgi:polyisoprenoid-binding protein YceI
MRKHTSILAAVVLLTATAAFADAETFGVDPAHSVAGFRIRHMMSAVNGKFDDMTGTVRIDRAKPENSAVEFRIKTASINTGVGDRDKHLRSAEFFEVDKYPEIVFKSTKVAPTDTKDLYNVTGTFTMKGVTKQLTLPVQFIGFAKDPWGKERAGFELETTLNRKDYGILWNKALDQGGFLLGDDVKVHINVEAVKQ